MILICKKGISLISQWSEGFEGCCMVQFMLIFKCLSIAFLNIFLYLRLLPSWGSALIDLSARK